MIVLVDYAHTPDALARVLDSVRAVAGRRLWCVFGCGGDRDASKRSPMGEAARGGADVVVVTSDNPRSEAPVDIARPIERGVRVAGLRELDLGTIARGDRGYTSSSTGDARSKRPSSMPRPATSSSSRARGTRTTRSSGARSATSTIATRRGTRSGSDARRSEARRDASVPGPTGTT